MLKRACYGRRITVENYLVFAGNYHIVLYAHNLVKFCLLWCYSVPPTPSFRRDSTDRGGGELR